MNIFIELFIALFKIPQLPISLSKKLHLVFALIKLSFLKIISKKKSPAKINLFGFTIEDYNYRLLDYLVKEVFVSFDYNFKADKSNPVIVDCGANVGMATLFFKWLYPNAKIYAFEPQPKTFGYLKSNVEVNNLKDVQIFNLALSNQNGFIDFYIDDSANLMGSILESRVSGQKVQVECKKLSDIVKEPIDLLKVDVEGAETLIMDDIIQNKLLNKQNIKQILMEYHHKIPNQKSVFGKFLIPFEESGYEYQLKTEYQNHDEFQDILIHFY
ncbi:MAG: FkbM family methyltransferase [Spirosomataceae bacterium]